MDIQAEDAGRAAGRPDQVEQQPDRRRLTRAVGPEEPEDLAGVNHQVDIDDASRALPYRFVSALVSIAAVI